MRVLYGFAVFSAEKGSGGITLSAPLSPRVEENVAFLLEPWEQFARTARNLSVHYSVTG